MQRPPHRIIWDDQHATGELIDAAELMRRLAQLLGAGYHETSVRDEPRYELQRSYDDGLQLRISAGHLFDNREVLSLAIELTRAGLERPLMLVQLAGGIQRVKASSDSVWLRTPGGAIVIVGAGIGGIVEVQC